MIILSGDFILLHNTSRLCSTITITDAGIALEELCAAHNLQWFNQHVFQPIGCSKSLDLVISDFSTPVSTSVHHPLDLVISDFSTPASISVHHPLDLVIPDFSTPASTSVYHPLDLVISDFSTPASTSVHHPLGRYDHATAITGFVPAPTHDRNRRSSGSSGTIRLLTGAD